MSWIDDLIGTSSRIKVSIAGTVLADAAGINFLNNATAVYNATTDKIDVTLTAAAVVTPIDITSFAATTATVQLGATVVNPTFVSAQNHAPTSLVLTNNANAESRNVLSTPTAPQSLQSYVRTTAGTYTFTLTAGDAIPSADTATATITWTNKVFWGVGAAGGATEAFIEALASSGLQTTRNKTFTVTASSVQKIYYACPTSYGTPTFTVGGFAGGFNAGTAINVTNTDGILVSYTLYESNALNLGTKTVSVT